MSKLLPLANCELSYKHKLLFILYSQWRALGLVHYILSNNSCNECLEDGWMDGWMNGWLDGWIDIMRFRISYHNSAP